MRSRTGLCSVVGAIGTSESESKACDCRPSGSTPGPPLLCAVARGPAPFEKRPPPPAHCVPVPRTVTRPATVASGETRIGGSGSYRRDLIGRPERGRSVPPLTGTGSLSASAGTKKVSDRLGQTGFRRQGGDAAARATVDAGPRRTLLCVLAYETFSEAPAKTSAQPLAATLLVSRPIFSISIVTESPGLSHRYGVRANPTPWQLSGISAA